MLLDLAAAGFFAAGFLAEPAFAADFAVDFAGVHKHVHDVIAAIEPNDSRARFTGLGVRLIEGAGHWVAYEAAREFNAAFLELQRA